MLSLSSSFPRLRSAIESTAPVVTAGVGDAAKPAAVAALALDRQAPVLLLTAREPRAEALADEIAAWLGDPSRVLRFPERDALPYERLAPDPAAVLDRLEAVRALRAGEARVVVASAPALAQRTLAPAAATEMIVLRTGISLDLDRFLGRLASLGFQRQALVEEPGQFSRRGGIIDVYAPGWSRPVRIELLGREIESLRQFDPMTQRSTGAAEDASIGPASELPVGGGQTGALSALLDRLDYSNLHPEAQERFDEEITKLREGLGFKEEHYYVPLFASGCLLDHITSDTLVVLDQEDEIGQTVEDAIDLADAARAELEQRGEIPRGLPSPLETWAALKDRVARIGHAARLSRWATEDAGAGIVQLPFGPATAYGGQLRKLVAEAIAAGSGGRPQLIVSQQAHRLAEIFAEEGESVTVRTSIDGGAPRTAAVLGSLSDGWKFSDGGTEITLLTDTEIFGFAKQHRAPPRRFGNREAFLSELHPGDHVVHIDHGIARFAGLVRRAVDGHEREYLELHYAEGDKLFVPTDQLDRVARYIGPSDRAPHVTRLSSGDWQRAKQRVRRAVRELARELLSLYAARELVQGHAYAADSAWQTELEASFPYVETTDQLAAITAVKRDMETARPMDRLVCGDVGYGKTEVAIRAAFKAVNGGAQVAVLVPTTVLAQQHYQTFLERLAAFPVRVEVLSRFRTDAEQAAVVEGLASGAVDVVVGTHRLLQKDVAFKELGLAIIDEEQRFGVAHKEHLKRMRREVDVLTLSATPIPRTLYMALGGIRDMSTIETPPEERLPIKTYVSEFDERLVREALMRENERGGQVYFVHNRVHNIEMIAEKVRDIAPEVRIGIGHGQMDEKRLARTMDDFVHGNIDVLVCTTIIESGLDIPNVNTIIINQADKLGLGQLYQLRGRVGRGAHRAYAYLLYDRRGRLTDTACQRLQTIFEATELGAGFQIALRDLEIRGAGNLLGAEQSGFMSAVGFDLYVRLLSGAVEHMRSLLRGETPAPEAEGPGLTVDLPLSAHLPPAYVPDLNIRIALYQRLSSAADLQEVSEIGMEMVDRFGEPPPTARGLLYIVSLRALAKSCGVQSITTENGAAVVRLEDGETTPKDALEAVVPRGVQVGRSVIHVDLGDRWRERLRETLEQLSVLRVAHDS